VTWGVVMVLKKNTQLLQDK